MRGGLSEVARRTTRRHAPAVAPLRRTPPAYSSASARASGFAIVGQAVAALMAAEERNVQRLLQPIQPAGDRGNPHVHLVGGAAQRSRPGDGEEYASIIPVKFCGHLFSIYGKRLSVFRSFISFAGMILRHSRNNGPSGRLLSPHLNVRAPRGTLLS